MSGRENVKRNKYEIDMCNGPLLGKMLVFALPLMLSGILQLMFNAADIIVVGRFAGSQALASVGSTGALINLIVNMFIGLSVGANVLVARYYGAGKSKEMKEVVHTAITAAFLSGLILVLIGCVAARPALHLMGTPEDVIDGAVLYMRLYFCGMPVMMVYNFGSAVLRAVGDTRRPLYYLSVAGVINVILNLIFVIVFHMSVAGVALATVISQIVSAVLVIRCLMRTESDYRLEIKELKIRKDVLIKMIQIGVPAGLQGSLFSISNVLIQSSVNSFGSAVMAGSAAAANLEGFVYTAMNSMYQAAISFVGQNYGAMKYKRIGLITVLSLAVVTVIGIVLGGGIYLLGDKLLLLYATDPAVLGIGLLRLEIVCVPYFICGMMDVMVGIMRGMGYAIMPMLVSLTGACAFRVVWVYTVFEQMRTLKSLYWSYPISWLLTFCVHLLCFFFVYRKLLKNGAKE